MVVQFPGFDVFLGTGDGGFQDPTSNTAAGGAGYAGDFNLDGKIDIAVSSGSTNQLILFAGSGNGSFSVAPGSPLNVGNTPQAICSGDFDGDTKPDLAISDWGGTKVNVLLNKKEPANPAAIQMHDHSNFRIYPNPAKDAVHTANWNSKSAVP